MAQSWLERDACLLAHCNADRPPNAHCNIALPGNTHCKLDHPMPIALLHYQAMFIKMLMYTLHSSQVMLWGLKRAMSGYLVYKTCLPIPKHQMNYFWYIQKTNSLEEIQYLKYKHRKHVCAFVTKGSHCLSR